MHNHPLQRLFEPKLIAVAALDFERGSRARVLWENIKRNNQPALIINPKGDGPGFRRSLRDPAEAEEKPDVVLICMSNQEALGMLEQCGKAGIRWAVLITPGHRDEIDGNTAKKIQKIRDQYGTRIVGPKSMGFASPGFGLNASMFNRSPLSEGGIALISQSRAFCASVLDWAADRGVGFSRIISTGSGWDLDIGESLQYLAADPKTKNILLCLETVNQARAFMSGLRKAARAKPTIVLRVGAEAYEDTASPHEKPLELDQLFQAAFKRCGVVRVNRVSALFSAAETLSHRGGSRGHRIAVITNGWGPGIMAVDAAAPHGIIPAKLSQVTKENLNKLTEGRWSGSNPIDLSDSASTRIFAKALQACLDDANVDGVLVVYTPQHGVSARRTAEAVAEVGGSHGKAVLACWMGGPRMWSARKILIDADIPTFETPDQAIDGFAHLVEYRLNRRLLMQTAQPWPERQTPQLEKAAAIAEQCLRQPETRARPEQIKELLNAFHIRYKPLPRPQNLEDAVRLAKKLGFPSRGRNHADSLGALLEPLFSEGPSLTDWLADKVADVLQKVTLADSRQTYGGYDTPWQRLVVRVVRNRLFGPVIAVSLGSPGVEHQPPFRLGIPPLNEILVLQMFDLLTAFPEDGEDDRPSSCLHGVQFLLKVSEIVCELPQLQCLTLHAVFSQNEPARVIDGDMCFSPVDPKQSRYHHLAIHPYPYHLEKEHRLKDGRMVTIRPIRPEDAEIERGFVRNLSEKSKYYRFMNGINELSREALVQFSQLDYDLEMALIAVYGEKEAAIEIGVARYAIYPDGRTCEFAIVIADEWQGLGLGHYLLSYLMEIAGQRGLAVMEGDVLAENRGMTDLAQSLGFKIKTTKDAEIVKAVYYFPGHEPKTNDVPSKEPHLKRND